MQQEGVIKFDLVFTPAPPPSPVQVREVNAWRQMLYLMQLIGQDPARYAGYGFGNISRRLGPFGAPPEARRFLISGTQTGGLPVLGPAHYATVLSCVPAANRVVAQGPVAPSSESLTHGMLYALDDTLRVVMHVHSPHLWRHARALHLPTTRACVPYGTPEMAEEVARLFRETDVGARRIFAMAGHEDGIVAFGRRADEAGAVLQRYLARAFQRDAEWHSRGRQRRRHART